MSQSSSLNKKLFVSLLFFVSFHKAQAKDRIPFNEKLFDGGVISAESLGRGKTTASNHSSGGSGSENPAALIPDTNGSFYSTVYVGTTRDGVDRSTITKLSPLFGKTAQYISAQAGQGVVFYEPISRASSLDLIDSNSPFGDSYESEISADALGFAASENWRGGKVGISIAYLRASLSSTLHKAGNPDKTNYDTADGMRLGLGFRYPTGPVMWGFSIQNLAAYLWWKDYRRTMLPLKLRVGNTWKASPGILFSVDAERRYYREGGNQENYIYIGNESNLSDQLTLRAGVFSNHIEHPDERHLTGGLTWKMNSQVEISYAIETYKVLDQRVKQSYLSFSLPFISDSDNGK